MLKTIKLKAINDNYTVLSEWLNKTIEALGISADLVNKINVCSEEIFINIASYAYKEEAGDAEVSLEKLNDELVLTFEDEGIEYNPLQKEDPDISLSLEERSIGGLGIFMVKKMTKNIEYERCCNKNILKLTFGTE